MLLWEFFFFNIKSWQWYITCGNSVRRKRTRITMRSRVVLSVLFLRLDLMFVGPWIRVCERMSYKESKKQNILANISHRSWWHFNYIIMTFFRSIFDEMGENVEWFWLIWRIYARYVKKMANSSQLIPSLILPRIVDLLLAGLVATTFPLYSTLSVLVWMALSVWSGSRRVWFAT